MNYKKICAIMCVAIIAAHAAPLYSSAGSRSETGGKLTSSLLIGGSLATIIVGLGWYWWKKNSTQAKPHVGEHSAASCKGPSTGMPQPTQPDITGEVRQHSDGKSIVYKGCCTEYIFDNGSYYFSPLADENVFCLVNTSASDPNIFAGKVHTKMRAANIVKTRIGGIEGHPHLQGPVGGWPKELK